MKSDTISNLELVHETAKALLVKLLPSNKEVWVPRSVIHERRNLSKKGEKGELVIDLWFSERNFQ